jgi:hypothetical protein
VPGNGSATVQATSAAAPSAVGTSAVTLRASTPPITVTVSPTSATVRINHSQQFTATVQNSTNQQVAWKVNGVAGGSSAVGTINNSGLYTAPSSVPSPNTVTITAVSAADATASGNASVTIVKRK